MDEIQLIKVALDSRAMLRRGESPEAVIQNGRESGASQTECIRILHDVGHMTLAQAKSVVQQSAAWKER